MAIGAVLGYFFYQKHKAFNSDAAKLVQRYIQQIDQKDSNLNTLLMKLGFGIDNQYDDIVKLVNSLEKSTRDLDTVLSSGSQDFESLKFAYEDYEALYLVKLDLVESFKTNNSALLNSANFAPYLGSVLVGKLNTKGFNDDANELGNYNAELMQYIRKANTSSKIIVNSDLDFIKSKINSLSGELQQEMEQYVLHVGIVLKHLEPTKQYLEKITAVETNSAIEKLAVINSKKRKADFQILAGIRTATMGFGIVLFLAFLSFLVKMRQLFFGKGTKAVLNLNEKIDKITHQIKAPIDFLNSNISAINNSFGSIRGTVEGLDGVLTEIKKPEPARNNEKVSQIMSKTLREYNSMHSNRTIEKTHSMIVGTSVGVEEISNLITVLREEAKKEM